MHEPSIDGRAWTRLDVNVRPLAGRWAEITYDVSLYAILERPALAWEVEDGSRIESLGAAPLWGRGTWIGRAPASARALWFSPGVAPAWSAEGAGRERFRLAQARALSETAVFLRALTRRPGLGFLALGAAVTGDRTRAERRLAAALAGWRPAATAAWRRARSRPPDWEGLERPDGASRPHVRFLVSNEAEPWLERLAGPAQGWSARKAAAGDRLATLIEDLAPHDLVAAPGPGGAFAPEAAMLAAQAGAATAADLFYVDEESSQPDRPPRLKPDWSPILAENLDLIGRAWFVRAEWARARLGDRSADAVGRLRPGPDDRVVHLRRVLWSGPTAAPAIAVAPPSAPTLATRDGRPAVSVIVPTRDRPDLLSACLGSLPRGLEVEIVVVDNGSTDPRALAILDEARRDQRLSVVDAPGPFNFSALCNAGARRARAPVLVFLNDDVEALDGGRGDWLMRMVDWALHPQIGAVGARLVYPDGRLQHGGVTLGMGGRAGHAERGAPGQSAGWFGRMGVPHEVSAVTGACLAVEARKFDAVGGFDAANLPVDLNDVDLCLRLTERGWTCLMEPSAHLLHRESASRGLGEGGDRYPREITYFTRRWAHKICDDPYHHPALSLASTTIMLG